MRRSEGFNHIGDPSFDPSAGGRILLPLECFNPLSGDDPCRRGAIGVADPVSLHWRYYVKVSAASARKLMWVEASPDGRLVWTSAADDLLAFAASEVNQRNAGPDGALRPVRRLRGALEGLPNVSGGAFWRGRLLLAGQSGRRFEVNSVDLSDGSARREIQLSLAGESEGLATVNFAGGVLQWQVMPRLDPFPPSYLRPTLLSFEPRQGAQRP
uniref:Unannotated protein n=1 Tax=freshwater metagenome TaxID=449393 RepID=A0A6J5ZXR9_9ZZZZ